MNFFITAQIPPGMGEGYAVALIAAFIIIPLIAIADVVFCYMVAQRVGVGKFGSLLIAIFVAIPCMAIGLFLASMVALPFVFAISIVLSWAVAKWARMGARDKI